MPGWLQTFVKVNPIYAAGHHRARADDRRPGRATSLMWTLVWMAILLVVFVPLALRGVPQEGLT